MSETFKSQALEANLAQTRYKDIFIPEEHQHFIDLSAKYFGINKRAKECITEYHHPLSNYPRRHPRRCVQHPLGDDAQPAEARSARQAKAQHHHHLDGVCQQSNVGIA